MWRDVSDSRMSLGALDPLEYVGVGEKIDRLILCCCEDVNNLCDLQVEVLESDILHLREDRRGDVLVIIKDCPNGPPPGYKLLTKRANLGYSLYLKPIKVISSRRHDFWSRQKSKRA